MEELESGEEAYRTTIWFSRSVETDRIGIGTGRIHVLLRTFTKAGDAVLENGTGDCSAWSWLDQSDIHATLFRSDRVDASSVL